MATNPGKVVTYNKELASFHKDTFPFSHDLFIDFNCSYTICRFRTQKSSPILGFRFICLNLQLLIRSQSKMGKLEH